jgi:hypothetical protein
MDCSIAEYMQTGLLAGIWIWLYLIYKTMEDKKEG